MIRARPALRALVAAGLLCVSAVDVARAAGALAIGTCGACGVSYDYDQAEAANAAALGQCSGHCQLATAMRGNCAALSIDMRNACGAYGYAAAPPGAEHGAALLLPQRRQGLRDPRLGV